MEFFFDPATYAALGTLVVLEVVLGIDNLVFIAILAEKLPPDERNQARRLGLGLALFMRLALLTIMSWLAGLKTPLFAVASFSFSARDIIMLLGGLFLLFKATTELHERLDGEEHTINSSKNYASFWTVVTQIVILDAVFSLDAVITAVGMVENLTIMMLAVTIAIGVMLLASKPLMEFVSRHKTVVVLCLGFLLLIGLSLLAEGFGFHIPKGYLYAAISFSIIIEMFNQIARHNSQKSERRKPLRLRTAQAVLRLMGHDAFEHVPSADAAHGSEVSQDQLFAVEEVNMVSRVLTFSERTVRSIMTHRSDVVYLDLEDTPADQRAMLLEEGYSVVPVCRGSLDDLAGVATAANLLDDILQYGQIREESLQEPDIVPETMRVMSVLEPLRKSTLHCVLVADEYGTIEGIITAVDVFEAVAGQMAEEGEPPAMQTLDENTWLLAGTTDVHVLETMLGVPGVVSESNDYSTLAGFMLATLDRLPEEGDFFIHEGYRFTVEEVAERRITMIRLELLHNS